MSKRKPGPELDRLVAEKVMGLVPGVDFGQWPEHAWKKNADGTIDTCASDYEHHNGPMCERCCYSYCEHCQDGPDKGVPCVKEPPSYSTFVVRAWEVVEKMCALGFVVQINNDEHCTVARIIDKNGDGIASAIEETAPHAICLAALRAMEMKS